MTKPLLFTLLSVTLTACTWDYVPEPLPCFTEDVQPIIVSHCAMQGCHNPIDRAEDLDLSTYEGVRGLVTPGKPGQSKLLTVTRANGEDRMPPSPYPALTKDQITLIETWISAGALAVSPCNSVSCDTVAGVSYSADIVPMLEAHCNSCHSGATPSAGINLTTYSGVKASVDNGGLMGSILYESGWVGMPWNSAPLSDCKKKIISTWVSEGAQNN